MWVPVDDENGVICVSFTVSDEEVDAWRVPAAIVMPIVSRSHIPWRNRANDYLIDRDTQKTESFSDIEGIRA